MPSDWQRHAGAGTAAGAGAVAKRHTPATLELNAVQRTPGSLSSAGELWAMAVNIAGLIGASVTPCEPHAIPRIERLGGRERTPNWPRWRGHWPSGVKGPWRGRVLSASRQPKPERQGLPPWKKGKAGRKPGSVPTRCARGPRGGWSSVWDRRYRRPQAALYGGGAGARPTRAPPRIRGLAPSRGLPSRHLSMPLVRSYRTLAPLPVRRAEPAAIGGVFLWHCPHGHPHWALPSRPGRSGARTFLNRLPRMGRSPARTRSRPPRPLSVANLRGGWRWAGGLPRGAAREAPQARAWARWRRRREKPKAAPAPSSGRGAGTSLGLGSKARFWKVEAK